ncbi:response regulator [Heyndrickxia sp. NPDC080065]|uniref:response regulator n=1 Tax=Heyndrickxia sp. NPDC080065 TaxID=3390568 RepID=UPI003D089524
MRLIIVDDEKLERTAISKMIQTEMPGIEIIGEAVNGRMAIQLAHELQPDLMMMDIKMPGIDGVEAVKEIRKHNKRVRFIMVSAFNTFEYAKEVMQQGVKEYLLKPSKKKDVLEALARVSEEIMEERTILSEYQHTKENLTRALSVIESEWLSSLLLNHIEDLNFKEWSNLLGIEVKSGYIVLFTVQDDHERTSNRDKRSLYSGLKSIMKTNMSQECVIGPMVDNKIPVLILLNTIHDKNRMKSKAIKSAHTVVNTFQNKFKNVKLAAGIGSAFDKIDLLAQSYHEAILALEQRKGRDVFFYADKEINLVPVFFEKERELLEWIKLGDRSRALQTFELYVEANQDQPKHFFEELMIMISRMLGDLGIHFEKRNFLQGDEWIVQLRQFVVDAVEVVQAWRIRNHKSYLQKAKEYIETNYEKNITLEEVAEYVDLSPFHFTKMFKEKFGLTFIDYLTDLRIEKAKNEILHTNKSLKEICFSVGYKDPNYFSRVFKKKTGVSPTSYRGG